MFRQGFNIARRRDSFPRADWESDYFADYDQGVWLQDRCAQASRKI